MLRVHKETNNLQVLSGVPRGPLNADEKRFFPGGVVPNGERQKDALVAMGDDAVPALVIGLKYPAGFDTKRALICECLGIIASPEAAPALSAALRDPVLAVTAWACWALERIRDPATSDAVRRYQDRLLSLASAGRIPAQVPI